MTPSNDSLICREGIAALRTILFVTPQAYEILEKLAEDGGAVNTDKLVADYGFDLRLKPLMTTVMYLHGGVEALIESLSSTDGMERKSPFAFPLADIDYAMNLVEDDEMKGSGLRRVLVTIFNQDYNLIDELEDPDYKA